jgi:hypothetical protein
MPLPPDPEVHNERDGSVDAGDGDDDGDNDWCAT